MLRKRSTPDSGGFFEVFSDLIFGVMAIFVLLFVIIISQIRHDQENQPSVDLMIAIDVSASMGDPLKELKESLSELVENFPSVIRDFRVGTVIYADWVGHGGINIFPLTTMDGRGKSALLDWIGSIQQKSGIVDTNLAIETAIAELGSPGDQTRRRSLLLIGDVGPFEMRGGQQLQDPSGNRPLDTRFVSEGVELVRAFAESSDESRVLVFFPNSEGYSFEGKRYQRWAYNESRDFFCTAARAAGPKGEFLDRDGRLMWSLLSMFLTVGDLEGKEGAAC